MYESVGLAALSALWRSRWCQLWRLVLCAQVLKDLPPKIIQDVLCQPSPLQKALYEDFAHTQVGGQLYNASPAIPHTPQPDL